MDAMSVWHSILTVAMEIAWPMTIIAVMAAIDTQKQEKEREHDSV